MSLSLETRIGNDRGGERRRTNSRLIIICFFTMIITPAIAELIGIGSGMRENRPLAQFPVIETWKHVKDLPRMLDEYVDDRFGLRRQLVHANSLLRYRMGISSNKNVVIGRDGWLFYTADRLMEQHTGADVFKPDELERWVLQMELDRDWLAKQGIAFYILLAPDKNTIYSEMLPDYPRPAGAPTRADQLAARLRSSTLEFIDPRAALIEATKTHPLIYSKGDTHWSQRGAFIAYQMLMGRIRVRFPTIEPKTIDDYSVSMAPAPADLAYQLALEDDLKYTAELFTLKGPSHQLEPTAVTSRPGWPWRITVTQTDLHNKPRVLIMGDSFTDYVLGPTFLYETFRDPVWTHHNNGTFNFELVKEIKPDIVIYQLAERYLHSPMGVPIGMNGDAPR
jgi:alginate O-acetyltransferase complex protein AlgJ